MPNVTMRELLEAGVHFGHQTNYWNPRMKPYVFGARNGIYIIDLQKTVEHTKAACEFIRNVVSEGKKVLFVGTKKQARSVIEEEAKRCDMVYVSHRWLGGMLTNYQTVKASIDRLKKHEALKLTEEWNDLTKKERARVDRELQKLNKSLGGIKDMKKLPGAIFIVDTVKEHIALKEAKKLGIPTVAVVDTNADPTEVSHVIPGNDDAIRSVGLFSRLIADSCIEGKKIFEQNTRTAADSKLKDDEVRVEKTESRFADDLDIKGVDEAELKVQEEQEALAGAAAEGDKAAAVIKAADEGKKKSAGDDKASDSEKKSKDKKPDEKK